MCNVAACLRAAERKKLGKNAALADNATVVTRDLITVVKKVSSSSIPDV